MARKNRDALINRIRQAIGGLQKHYAGTASIVLDGTATKPSDAVATLTGAITAIDAALSAENAFHGAVAAQLAAIAAAEALLAALNTLVVNQFGKKGAQLADFGMAKAPRQVPSEEVKAAAVAKRAATRAARGTKGPKAKLAIKGTPPATPAAPAKPGASGA